MLKNNYLIKLCVVFLIASASGLIAQDVFLTDRKTIESIKSLQPLQRDWLILSKKNTIFSSRVRVEKVDQKGEYKKAFCIYGQCADDTESLRIFFNIYMDNPEYAELLKQGDIFDFKGQFAFMAPLNASRSAYSIDIILQEGSLVIEHE